MALKRPILIGGLGLSASLWLLETVHFGMFDSSTLFSAMALGSGVWWWRQRDRDRSPAEARPIAPPVVNRTRVEAELANLATLIQTLKAEAALAPANGAALPATSLTTYEQRCQTWLGDLDRQSLTVAVVGDPRTGKSTLIDWLTATALLEPGLANLSWREVTLSPNENSAVVSTDDTLAQPAEAHAQIAKADAVLLLTDGDLTDSCWGLLKDGVMAGQGAVLVFNKSDHYDLADQQVILTQLQHQVATLPVPVAVVKAAAAPRPIKVRRHQADGGVEEWMEPAPPALGEVATALTTALVPQTATLVAATTLRQIQALRPQVQADLNRLRRDRALPLIDQLQWVAAAAAFVNPVPTLDLLATVAINGQLIMDLGKIYGFNLSLDEAKTAAGTLASLTVKLGLVELSTQALTAVLKSHFATYVAGGVVQGLSAAYLTRMAGLSLIDYFEQSALAGTPASALSWEAIAQRLQTVIQQNRQVSLLQTLVKQGIDILKPTPNPALLTAATTPALDLVSHSAPAEAEPRLASSQPASGGLEADQVLA